MSAKPKFAHVVFQTGQPGEARRQGVTVEEPSDRSWALRARCPARCPRGRRESARGSERRPGRLSRKERHR